jgi:hypothetical protein
MSDKKPRITGVGEAVAKAIEIQRDPTNRSIHCSCGTVFLSGAAEKDSVGRAICFGCGTPHAGSS